MEINPNEKGLCTLLKFLNELEIEKYGPKVRYQNLSNY